jgi:hypothetical protein
VKAFLYRSTVAVGATAVSVAMFGTGVANAGLVGMTYADAVTAIKGWNGTPVVTTVVGDQLPKDDCIVTRAEQKKGTSKTLLSLNCNQLVASQGKPGNSVGSPEGRKAHQELVDQAWRATPDGQAWCQVTEKEHPEWFPLKGC